MDNEDLAVMRQPTPTKLSVERQGTSAEKQNSNTLPRSIALEELLTQKAHTMSIINCMKERPAELFDLVLKTAMGWLLWRPTDSPKYNYTWLSSQPSLESSIEGFFRWPPTVGLADRNILNARAAPIFLRRAIVELPARFLPQDSAMRFDVPMALRGIEDQVRHLVFDVIVGRDYNYQCDLNRMIRYMEDLKKLFPALRSCVICVFFRYVETPSELAFDVQILNRRHRTGFNQTETIGISLSRLISAFHSKGPGARKFIRFGQDASRDSKDFSIYGPLVDISSVAANLPCQASHAAATDATNVQEGFNVEEKVLERAFSYHREGKARKWRS